MIETYTTLCDCQSVTVIKKSKFIAYLHHIESEKEAIDFLKNLRKMHSDSTHICYGYVADIEGKFIKFSDDGEPSGTAGKPILNILKTNFRQVLVAVVRYFGGILLGAGGLVRAYGGAAEKVVAAAESQVMRYSAIYKLKLDFTLYNKIAKNLCDTLCKIIDLSYNSTVNILLACSYNFDFKTHFENLTRCQAKYELIEYKYIDFN